MAERQGTVGLVAAGLEHVVDMIIPQEVALNFARRALQIEQRNRAMNRFVAETVADMLKHNIYTVLVKGQGLAQCYERPLWRPAGDVDFFFSKDEYPNAIKYFQGREGRVIQNANYTKSFGVVIEPWFIEIHGTLRNLLSSRMDRTNDEVQRDIFYGGNVRSWDNEGTQIFLPNANNDLFLLFAHFVRHFYQDGFSIRQLCDWCRLLWTFKGLFDVELLWKRLKNAGLENEWKVFSAVVVDYLAMPLDAIPLYEDSGKWHHKGDLIMSALLKRSEEGYKGDIVTLIKISPLNTIHVLPGLLLGINWMKVKERILRLPS